MPQLAAASLSADDLAAIRKLNDEPLRCVLSQDFEGLARLYTEDAAYMPPNHPVVQGRAAILKWLAGFPRVTAFRLEYHEIDGRGDLAYVRGAYFITLQPDNAPGPVEDIGKFLIICRKQPDGSWLFAAETYNSDK